MAGGWAEKYLLWFEWSPCSYSKLVRTSHKSHMQWTVIYMIVCPQLHNVIEIDSVYNYIMAIITWYSATVLLYGLGRNSYKLGVAPTRWSTVFPFRFRIRSLWEMDLIHCISIIMLSDVCYYHWRPWLIGWLQWRHTTAYTRCARARLPRAARSRLYVLLVDAHLWQASYSRGLNCSFDSFF